MNHSANLELGLVGLGTMGMSLLLNMADHGHAVAGYHRNPEKLARIRAAALPNLHGFSELAPFVRALRRPRVVMLLVPAGAAVDAVIAELLPLLEAGDFVVDAGNSFHRDTTRRIEELEPWGVAFVGMGVSGGESGARRGPSMMPGGGAHAWERLRAVLESVAARAGDEPCVAPMGKGAAGHYVKMIHNGIEYGLMQMLAECYDVMRRRLGMTNAEMAAEFARWNAGRLQSFLVEITVTVLGTRDPLGAGDLIDAVADRARGKGTGKWTSQDAMDLGVPVPAIDAAVTARAVSARQAERRRLAALYPQQPAVRSDRAAALAALEQAYSAAAWIAYAQGFAQIDAASREHGFGTDLATVARIRRADPRAHPRRVRVRSRAEEPAARSRRRSGARSRHRGPARHGLRRRRVRHPVAGAGRGARVVRRHAQRAPAREPDPGPARPLRRAHLRAPRPRGQLPLRVGAGLSALTAPRRRFP